MSKKSLVAGFLAAIMSVPLSISPAIGSPVLGEEFVTLGLYDSSTTWACNVADPYELVPSVSDGKLTYQLTPGTPLPSTESKIPSEPYRAAYLRAGSVFFKERVSLTAPFEINAELNFDLFAQVNGIYEDSNFTDGADGIAFVIQTESSRSLSSGGGLGFGSLKPVVAVEFDTYANNVSPDWGDVNGELEDNWGLLARRHDNQSTALAVDHNVFGVVPDSFGANATGTTANQYNLGQIEDGQWKKFQFSWDPTTNARKLTAKFDKNGNNTFELDETLVWSIDIQDYLNSTEAFMGFTSAVGAATSSNQVRLLETGAATFTARTNSPPTLPPQDDVELLLADGLETFSFTLGDDATTLQQWQVSAVSSDTSLATVTSSLGSVTSASIAVTPLTVGTTTITLTVTDADGLIAVETFDLTVNQTQRINQAPTISSQAQVTLDASNGPQTFDFTLSDDFTPESQWQQSVTSSDTDVATVAASITSATNLRVVVTPVSAGDATISVSVEDFDDSTTSTSFDLTVTATAQPYSGPLITDVGADGLAGRYSVVEGQQVDIVGSRLESMTRVFISGIEATVLDVSANLLRITIPAGLDKGNHDLQVISAAGSLSVSGALLVSSNGLPSAASASLCVGVEASWWTKRISETEAKVYIKCPAVNTKYEVFLQTGGNGDYERLFNRTLTDEADTSQRFNENGRYFVRTIALEEINRLRILVDGERSWQVRYNSPYVME